MLQDRKALPRPTLSKKQKWLRRGIRLLIAAAVITAFCVWQNEDIVITEFLYTNAKIPQQLDGYTIVQVSDLQNAEFGEGNRRLLADIRKAEPDIIVITGDLADSNHTDIPVSVAFAQEAVSIAPVYFITGNHERWLEPMDYDTLIAGLSEAGVVMMDDRTHCLADGLYLVGLSDQSLRGFDYDDRGNGGAEGTTLDVLMSDVPDDAMTVVLAHEPQFMPDYAASDADLVLCGHAHGGQFRIPFTNIGLYAPDQGFFPKYNAGAYTQGKTTMYVSRGLGNSVIPVRVFNRPELVKIVLRAK